MRMNSAVGNLWHLRATMPPPKRATKGHSVLRACLNRKGAQHFVVRIDTT
jgi:hypothetical protein